MLSELLTSVPVCVSVCCLLVCTAATSLLSAPSMRLLPFITASPCALFSAITFNVPVYSPPRNCLTTCFHHAVWQELTRWSLLSDEACDMVLSSKQRLAKISEAVRPSDLGERQPLDGTIGGSVTGGNGKDVQQPPPHTRKTSTRGVLGRLSLGGSRKTLAGVFAVEPPRPPSPRRQSSAGSARLSRVVSPRPMAGGGSGSTGSVKWGSPRDAQAQDDRRALFGERIGGEDGERGAARDSAKATTRAAGGVSGAHAALSEAHDLAVERGEKLENLVDKSRQLEDSALAFGNMAKQLRQQQEAEACCVA